MTERKRRRQAVRKKNRARPEPEHEETVVEIVFGDPDEPPNPEGTADSADHHSQSGSPSQTNRFVFRF